MEDKTVMAMGILHTIDTILTVMQNYKEVNLLNHLKTGFKSFCNKIGYRNCFSKWRKQCEPGDGTVDLTAVWHFGMQFSPSNNIKHFKYGGLFAWLFTLEKLFALEKLPI